MTSSVNRLLDIVLNVLVASAAVAVLWSVILQRPSMPPGPIEPYRVGDRFANVLGNDSGVETGVVLWLSSSCRFCTESMPFYARLVDFAAKQEIRVMALGRESVEKLSDYLDEHSVKVDTVLSASASDAKLSGTPVIVVLSQGVVRAMWRGASLSGSSEDEVLQRIGSILGKE